MFTGLIETVGVIDRLSSRSNYRLMTISSPFAAELVDGESVCCDGVCLTVIERTSSRFVVEASQETSARTILGDYRVGSRINLERSLRADSRLGGHIVSGHVDCAGRVEYLKPIGDSLELTATFDARFDPLVIEKGSIAINGVSLTVNKVESARCAVNVIPYTVKATTLSDLKPGNRVNLEFDMIGKYVAKLGANYRPSGVTLDTLRESGW
ncbi:MAG: riboflavin synthase [candidate division Zixibacteria bacterium]|nr:riboflavin synthase [candidate division Zixibacteria bacterium]